MKVLLSIKPEFADKIFDGTKAYEFRKSIFKNTAIKKIVVYSSSPVKKVIGEFEIEDILIHDPITLWNKTKESAGISEDFFFKYFNDKTEGYAIKIKNIKRYKKPKCIRADFNLAPPQSFAYLNS
jgi:predicted transcriptional regulator